MNPTSTRENAVRWIRDTLDLSQRELGSAIGMAEQTVRSVEAGRLKLSRKFAGRLAALTGIDADRLMRNDLGTPLPDQADVRSIFRVASGPYSPVGQIAQALPLVLLLRAFLIQAYIAAELGELGCQHTGFNDETQKGTIRQLGKIPNTRTRQRVFQQANDLLAKGDPKEIKALMEKSLAALEQLRDAARKSTKKNY
jgi:transcriptional regulator with XRE-family HTH domain